MSSLDDALPLVRASAEPAGPDGDPGDGLGPFGAMIAAMLARQMDPAVARAAVIALGEQGLADPSHLHDAGMPEIHDALRGKVRAIAPRSLAPAKQMARWLVDHHGGDARSFAESSRSTDDLREELAGIRGVGQVGADAVLLAALKRPTYPVDRGTYRILVRHGWLEPSAGYEEARDLIVHHAGGNPEELLAIAAGMERLAASHCRASAPRCDACPLRGWLPEGGPLGLEDA